MKSFATKLLPDKTGKHQGLLLDRESFFPVVKDVPFTTRCVTTPHHFSQFMEALSDTTWASFDTETTHIRPRWSELVGMSFCWNREKAWYIPVRCHKSESCLSLEYVMAHLREWLSDPSIKKIGQNLKYDMLVLKNYGVDLNGVSFDTLIASYLLDAGSRRHNLDLLAKRYLNYTTIKIAELIGFGSKQLVMSDVPLSSIAPYAAEDAWVVAQLAPLLYNEAVQQGLTRLLDHVEIPLIRVLAQMEHGGIAINTNLLATLAEQFDERIQEKESSLKSQAGESFNPNSSDHVRNELFTKLGASSDRMTEGGEYSTDKTVLSELASRYPFAQDLVDYRQLAKLQSTYVHGLSEVIFPNTGRIHCSFNQAVTATGRLSSSDPNLQNIPVRTDDGKQLRRLFVGEEGNLLVASDYSQIELRVLAHYSGDKRLQEAFAGDEDIHAIVASQIAGISLKDVTPQMRKAAKNINFGIIYGQGPKKLAVSTGVSEVEARAFIDDYFKTYPSIKKFKRDVLAGCRSRGYVETILGRRRYLDGIYSEDHVTRASAERMAVNTVIQGSAADIIKLAMLEVYTVIEKQLLPAKLLLQVHDELVFEVSTAVDINNVCNQIKAIMEGVVDLCVPLRADVKYGPSWGDMVAHEVRNN